MIGLLIVCRLILPWSGETLEQRAFLASGAEESAFEECNIDENLCEAMEQACTARGFVPTFPLELDAEVMDLEEYAGPLN